MTDSKDLYVIRCDIPRMADCENGQICRRGGYCKEMEVKVLTVSADSDLKEDIRFLIFDSREKAERYLNETAKK